MCDWIALGCRRSSCESLNVVWWSQDIDLLAVRDVTNEEKTLVVWNSRLQNYWKKSPYYLEETSMSGELFVDSMQLLSVSVRWWLHLWLKCFWASWSDSFNLVWIHPSHSLLTFEKLLRLNDFFLLVMLNQIFNFQLFKESEKVILFWRMYSILT